MTIKERYDDLAARIRKHDAARKILEGELAALRHECTHPNGQSRTYGSYDGSTDTEFNCPDCGKHTST